MSPLWTSENTIHIVLSCISQVLFAAADVDSRYPAGSGCEIVTAFAAVFIPTLTVLQLNINLAESAHVLRRF